MKRYLGAVLLALFPFIAMFFVGIYCSSHSVKNVIKYTEKDGVVIVTDCSNLKK